jgi:homeobox protein cut-like
MSSGTLPGVATEASGAGAAGDAAASSPLLLAPPTPDSSGGGSGALLDIVVHQRDRFRQRVAQLEDEKSEWVRKRVGRVSNRWKRDTAWLC